jgi:hypothetical protein
VSDVVGPRPGTVFKRRKPALYAYLEAVLEEVWFEMGSQHPKHARD